MDPNFGGKEGAPGDKKRNTNFCSVPQCRNYGGNGIHLHQFPKDTTKRAKWEAVLKMGKPASDSMKVCSAHFLGSDYFPGGMLNFEETLICTAATCKGLVSHVTSGEIKVVAWWCMCHITMTYVMVYTLC